MLTGSACKNSITPAFKAKQENPHITGVSHQNKALEPACVCMWVTSVAKHTWIHI